MSIETFIQVDERALCPYNNSIFFKGRLFYESSHLGIKKDTRRTALFFAVLKFI